VMVGRVHMNYLFANGIAILVCSLVNFCGERWVGVWWKKSFSPRSTRLHADPITRTKQ
jgi:hypothetical protein